MASLYQQQYSFNSTGLEELLLTTDLEVVVLPLLLSLEVEPGESSQVLLAHCLVHCGPTPDPLTIVVSCVCPPVCLGLHKPQDHVLYGGGQPGHLRDTNRVNCWSLLLHEVQIFFIKWYHATAETLVTLPRFNMWYLVILVSLAWLIQPFLICQELDNQVMVTKS